MIAVLLARFTLPLDAPFTEFRYWKDTIELVDSALSQTKYKIAIAFLHFSFSYIALL